MTTKNTTSKTRRAKGEGSIFQRKDGKWIGRLTYEDPETGRSKVAQVSGSTKRKASEALKALRQRLDEGQPVRDSSGSFGEYAHIWIMGTLQISDRKQSTKTLYAGLARTHIVNGKIGETPIKSLTPNRVETFVGELRDKGLSSSTIRQIYTVGRLIGDTMVRDGLAARNPFTSVPRPKVERSEALHLTDVEVSRVLEEASGTRYGLLFELILNTGLRRGEALALRWLDVNLSDEPKQKPKIPAVSIRVEHTLTRQDGQLVTTDPKSARSKRVVPLNSEAVEILKALRVRQAAEKLKAGNKWSETGYVFTTELGDPCDPRNALRAFSVAADRAGVPGAGLHTLRHTFATDLLNNGVPIVVVSRVLGHGSIQVTVDTYGHDDPDVTRSALDLLPARRSATSA